MVAADEEETTMAVKIVPNTREGAAPVAPPLNEAGRFYEYGLYYEGGRTIAWSDSFEELVNVLTPGYLDTTDEQERLVKRITLAISAQRTVQAQLYVDADSDLVRALTDQERALLDGSSRDQPVIEDWNSDIQLVLITTRYQPHTDTPAPVSKHGPYLQVPNMLWIDPITDESLMTSLHEIGWVRVVRTIAPEEGALAHHQ